MSVVRLIVGLGNPGPTHHDDRHNAGFWLLDSLAAHFHGHFRHENRFHGELARIKLQEQDIWLLKPQTYMNRSGRSVAAVAQFFRLSPADILVVHDELDLEPGVVRIKRGGGSGGHNGLKDISAALGSPDYGRVRIGIGHPRHRSPGEEVANYVLHRPQREEYEAMQSGLSDVLTVMPLLVAGQWERVTQTLHASAKRS